MPPYVLGLEEIDQTQIAVVGGKAANLGELMRLDGLRVPPGFCVTTAAFDRVVADSASSRLEIERIVMPDDVATAISDALERCDVTLSYAVRSSATAEDSPSASFAGQHDSYLNVRGAASVLESISRCWGSLFSDRAIAYRLKGGLDQRKVRMAVVVQQMVSPIASGVLFTADPVSGNRKVTSIEACFGLGEALVSGRVNPDVYVVRDGLVASKAEHQAQPVLTDAQIIQLTGLGRRIEAHFGRPQDIEWCLADEGFFVVQSRPITTLFPIPRAGDDQKHVYVSVGHQQMMTDPIKPLGLCVWQLTSPAPMRHAGGRLFVDVTATLASPDRREGLIAALGRSDPLIGDALRTIVDREFIPTATDAAASAAPAAEEPPQIDTDRAVVTDLIGRSEASLAVLKREIRPKSGAELVEFIIDDIQHELRRILVDRRSYQVFASAMEASWQLNERLEAWLGEKNAVDILTQSVPDNVTSEMGLALMDVADVVRAHPDVVTFLDHVDEDDFLTELPGVPGGPEAIAAITGYLDTYGMRCVGEIDITRPRWSERPRTLVPLILGNVRNFEPGEGLRRFEEGRRQADDKQRELLGRLRALPDGEAKAAEAEGMIQLVRTFIGYREYPKFHMISRYFVYKLALLREAERLVERNVLETREDLFFLSLQEFRDVLRAGRVDADLIRERKAAFASFQSLTPPRVLTSDGEAVTGTYRRDDAPAGALVGLPVSAGVIEGRARVVLDFGGAEFEPDDILVTAFTDPSWTPVFLAVKGLVTEVGGLMTHGAVIAREYGLPAVVGVEHATRLIQDGQRIRVHGTEGYVELLS